MEQEQEENSLFLFLSRNNLLHLLQPLCDQGADLEFLTNANDHELSLLIPRVIDKGKLRIALQELKNCQAGQAASTSTVVIAATPKASTAVRDCQASVSTAHTGVEWDYANYDEVLSSIEFSKELCDGSLKTILESSSAGRPLLDKQILSTGDRKIITAIIVEAEVRKLKNITNPIRKEVWENWTTEITKLFPGETTAVYYSAFRIVDGRALQASGLIVNRLITVRRKLTTNENRRSRRRDSDSSSSSGNKKPRTSETGRVRPLPESFSLKDIGNQETQEENCLQWLQASSSPRDLLANKWKNSLRERLQFLQEGDHIHYMRTFPALQCPWGYELLADDFHVIYPEIEGKFQENFPLVKSRLLSLLDDKAQQLTRPDKSIQSVLDLAALGEETANVATFLSIPLLLKQMHTITIKGTKKPWNPSRSEVSNAFLSLVPTVSDVEIYRLERETTLATRKIPVLPFIVAVGPSWSDVTQYDVIIAKDIRYTFPNISEAVTSLFKILWALDLAYPKDCLPIWMFIQRSIYQMKSKYDVEGTPVLDLLVSVTNRQWCNAKSATTLLAV